MIGVGLLAAAVVGVGMAAYVRLAPVDAMRWHTPLPTDTRILEGDCAKGARTVQSSGGAQFACLPDTAPIDVLARLDAVALATPRTRRIAGSPEEGRITWETRSRIFGFPDYTTAQVRDNQGTTRLDIVARQRFGRADSGVNAARLGEWLSRL